jgi:RNA polymerase sigma-70 factor (ECF subfamily)
LNIRGITDETPGPGRFILKGRLSLNGLEREMVELLPRLRRFGRALTRDTSDADDLVQLTVERALARQGQWRTGTRLDSWMFGIMKNAWIDESRARRRHGAVLAPAEEGERVGDDGAAAMEARLGAGEVERAMARLPDDQRLAVALVLVEGLSYQEAAQVTQAPVGTLASRVARGRTALMAQLQETAL